MRILDKPIRTFDGILNFKPRRTVECESLSDVSAAIVDAVSSGLKVRGFGSGCSWAPHVVTNDVCVNLYRLNKIHSVNTISKTIVVDAGVELGEVSRALAAHGLCLPSLSFHPEVTIGGAVATGTHGSSPRWGTLSDFVVSMDVVLASGNVHTFGPRSPHEELFAARTAIGMLGVIVRLELQAIAMQWVRHSELNLDLATFRAQLGSILGKYDHVWAHWILGTDVVRVECLKSRMEPAQGFHRYVEGRNECWNPPARLLSRVVNSVRGSAHEILRRLRRPRIRLSMQYGVPMAELGAAIDRIQASNFPATHNGRVVELKFIKGKGASYLGANTDGDAALLNLWWLVDQSNIDIFQPFEDTMLAIHARPHWGKLHSAPDMKYMRSAYPDWTKFHEVQSRYDPSNVFSIFRGHASH